MSQQEALLRICAAQMHVGRNQESIRDVPVTRWNLYDATACSAGGGYGTCQTRTVVHGVIRMAPSVRVIRDRKYTHRGWIGSDFELLIRNRCPVEPLTADA